MTLSDIKREQANATDTLNNIDSFVATAGPLSPATVWFLTEEAEGAFNQFRDCAVAMGIKTHNKTPREMAEKYIKSAIKNIKK